MSRTKAATDKQRLSFLIGKCQAKHKTTKVNYRTSIFKIPILKFFFV